MAVNWIGPGVVTSVISDTNYTVDIPEKKNTNTIYYINLMKLYYKRPEYVNLILEEYNVEIEERTYLTLYPILLSLIFNELYREGNLESKLSTGQINTLRDLLIKYRKVFSTDPGTTHLVEMEIKLIDD